MTDARRRLAAVVVSAAAAAASAADADLLGLDRSAGAGDAREAAELIGRNADLARLAEFDPDLARLIALRLLELAGGAAPASGDAGGTANPDIDGLKRSSPEAVLDLIELMRKASKARSAD